MRDACFPAVTDLLHGLLRLAKHADRKSDRMRVRVSHHAAACVVLFAGSAGAVR